AALVKRSQSAGAILQPNDCKGQHPSLMQEIECRRNVSVLDLLVMVASQNDPTKRPADVAEGGPLIPRVHTALAQGWVIFRDAVLEHRRASLSYYRMRIVPSTSGTTQADGGISREALSRWSIVPQRPVAPGGDREPGEPGEVDGQSNQTHHQSS